MEEMNGFTVCVLLFGNHPDLAERCLRSIVQRADWTLVKDIRIACNGISQETVDIVHTVTSKIPTDVAVHVYAADANRFKYPMMRRMLYDVANPVITQFIMWFDDDSYIDPSVTVSWWNDVYRTAQKAAVTGAIYRIPPRGNQLVNIMKQPWYGKLEWPAGYRFRFATGGWWVARTRFLQSNDYPFRQIVHNGGDVMLGELCRQRNETIASFVKGIHINADGSGKNSTAPRRGASHEPVFAKNEAEPANYEFDLFRFDPRVKQAEPEAQEEIIEEPDQEPPVTQQPVLPVRDKLIRLPGF